MSERIKKKIIDRYLDTANPATESAKIHLARMLNQVPTRYLVLPLLKEDLEKGVGPGILTKRYDLTINQIKYIGAQVGVYPRQRDGVKG